MLTKKKELYNRRRQRSEIDRILQKQRAFFAEGKTYEIRFRKAALKRLEASILAARKGSLSGVDRRSWKIGNGRLYVRGRADACGNPRAVPEC